MFTYCILIWSRLSTLESLPHLLLFPFISSLGLQTHLFSQTFLLSVSFLASFVIFVFCFFLLSLCNMQLLFSSCMGGVSVPRSHFVFCLAPPKRLEQSTGKLKQIPLQNHFSCPDYAQFPFNRGNELFIHSFIYPVSLFSMPYLFFPPALKTL